MAGNGCQQGFRPVASFVLGGQESAPKPPQAICKPLNQNLIFIPIFGTFKVNYNEMAKNTSISLGSYFDQFVSNRINEGRFKNVSEVIRAGLRLLEEEENKAIALKNAIREGIDSGLASDFQPKTHLESLKKNKKING